jgi:hypothetical protein
MKTAKNPMVALAESLARDVLHGWRWFIEDDWIVFEVPGRSEISIYDMQTIAAQPHVLNVAAVFRCAPHTGVYVRFQLRSAARKTKGAPQALRERANNQLRDSVHSGDARNEVHDPDDNAIGGPNDYAYGM